MFLHGSPRFTAEDQQRLAAERPELVDAFNGFSAEIRDAEAAGASREELDARLKTFILEGWFVHLMADRDTATERLRQIYADTRFSWRHSQYANSETAAGYNLADLLPSIPVRSLVMAGAHDVLPPENVRLLHEGLPDSRFVVFENSSHYAPIEEPLKFRATILEFLGIEP